MDDRTMAPRQKTGQPMVEIRFSVPSELAKEMLEVGESAGMSESAAHRYAWMLGTYQFFEQNNKRLVSRKLAIKLQQYQESGEWEDDDK